MNISKLVKQIDEIVIKGSDDALKRKFELIHSGLNHLKAMPSINLDEADELFKRIYWLGYEIGHNKATEMGATDFHKPLVLESVEIVRKIPLTDKRMVRPLKEALVYEYDEVKRKVLEKEIAKIESQL